MSKNKPLSDAIDLPDQGYAQHIRNVSESELHSLQRALRSKRTERMRQEYVKQKAALFEQQLAAQADSQEVFQLHLPGLAARTWLDRRFTGRISTSITGWTMYSAW